MEKVHACISVRVEIDMEEPLQQELVIEKEGGDPITLVLKYEKLGKLCFICGVLGHTNNFCDKKAEANEKNVGRQWGRYIRAESSSANDSKSASKWLVGGRSASSGGRRGADPAINESNGNNSKSGNGHEFFNHRIYGRIKVTIDPDTRLLQFYKYTECQRSNGADLIRWWTNIDPMEVHSRKNTVEEPRFREENFASNLGCSDQINKVLVEGMSEQDKFRYQCGGGTKEYLAWLEKKAQNHRMSPQQSLVGESTGKIVNEGSLRGKKVVVENGSNLYMWDLLEQLEERKKKSQLVNYEGTSLVPRVSNHWLIMREQVRVHLLEKKDKCNYCVIMEGQTRVPLLEMC